MLFELDDLLTSRQIAGVYTGFKKTTLEARGKTGRGPTKKKKKSSEEELDEVNQLFETEGDEELEYETEPLFDEEEAMRRAINEDYDEFFIPEEKHEEKKKEEVQPAHRKKTIKRASDELK